MLICLALAPSLTQHPLCPRTENDTCWLKNAWLLPATSDALLATQQLFKGPKPRCLYVARTQGGSLPVLDEPDSSGMTPVQLAAQQGHQYLAIYLAGEMLQARCR